MILLAEIERAHLLTDLYVAFVYACNMDMAPWITVAVRRKCSQAKQGDNIVR